MKFPSSISAINRLADAEKREIYIQVIPPELRTHFQVPVSFLDSQGRDLIRIKCSSNSPAVEMAFYHQFGFPDPVLYGHLTDTLNGQVHILLYIINNPDSPRFDVDQLPDGTPTKFGILRRNLQAEKAAMEYGLAPGQVRRGMRFLRYAIAAFEQFVQNMGQDYYFAEPLYYHNAIIFERYGFTYQKGRKLMEHIQAGFAPGGNLLPLLDNSTPFRQPAAANSIRLRSWAIHDGILGEPFTNVTMYKRIGKFAGVSTCGECNW